MLIVQAAIQPSTSYLANYGMRQLDLLEPFGILAIAVD